MVGPVMDLSRAVVPEGIGEGAPLAQIAGGLVLLLRANLGGVGRGVGLELVGGVG